MRKIGTTSSSIRRAGIAASISCPSARGVKWPPGEDHPEQDEDGQ